MMCEDCKKDNKNNNIQNNATKKVKSQIPLEYQLTNENQNNGKYR